MDKTTTLGLPPLPGVDSERDAKAVIRRMRMQGRQPDSSTLDVQSFNQLIVAAKDDVVADDAAAKDELTYYRNLLDKDKPRRPPPSHPPTLPSIYLTPSTIKLPSLKNERSATSPIIVNPTQSNQLERPPTRSKADKPVTRDPTSTNASEYTEPPTTKPQSPPSRAKKLRPIQKSVNESKAPGAIDIQPVTKLANVSKQHGIGDDGANNDISTAKSAAIQLQHGCGTSGGPRGLTRLHASNNPPPPNDTSTAGPVRKPKAPKDKDAGRGKKKADDRHNIPTLNNDNQQLEERSNPLAPPSLVQKPKKPHRITNGHRAITSTTTQSSSIDCVDTFDDDEPEMDSAPVWREDDMMLVTSGYGSDDGTM
ncbi:hypothetical protein H257_06505 [Aphanomyces astaci]|uniref:Uncharacterized protein n=1 Tax=Aphanomyces astaci TaxID=112090 RepID=W4GKE0_APHAT|nr:hypothetical protein H257_06505 [Aphanomyces astaci]ETV80122.1 hypothetical protein H257_06505 [Aphanomyces astaci]|eukprot:XP_009830046.1 hypothetical protein H257_06505 [Aphanomyces astaci]